VSSTHDTILDCGLTLKLLVSAERNGRDKNSIIHTQPTHSFKLNSLAYISGGMSSMKCV
jgi:hypothetical protein